MPSDNDFLQGAQIGLGIAQAWAQRSARQQELRIQDAYRRMQERQLAAQAEHLAAQTKDIQQKAQLAVDERAEFDKARIGMAADIDLGMPPDQSMIKNLMPAVAKYHPDKVGGLVLDAARIPLIKAQQDAAAALAENRRMDATDKWLGAGDNGIEVLDIAGTGKKAVRVRGANTLHIVEPEKLSRVEEINYQQALRDLSTIDRELAKEPPHPTGRDEKGEKVQIISDKRNNLLKQRRAAEDRIRALVAKQTGGTMATGQPPSQAPPAEFDSAESVRDAFRAGKLPKEDALRILEEKFGIK